MDRSNRVVATMDRYTRVVALMDRYTRVVATMDSSTRVVVTMERFTRVVAAMDLKYVVLLPVSCLQAKNHVNHAPTMIPDHSRIFVISYFSLILCFARVFPDKPFTEC